jgi:cytochrome c oxidase accessory protein FixG
MATHKDSPLFQKHIPIFVRSVEGKFRNFKTAILVLAYTVYFALPWVQWERASAANQAVMFDLVSKRFFIFNLAVYPQDIFWLSMLLFIAAIFLFFVTGLVGRAWCGYFCFQTLWTDMFMLIEHMIQGERPARVRLYKQPWNMEKILKVGSSHFFMILISFWTGFTFIAYFGYAPELLYKFFTGNAADVAYITVAVLGISTYVAGGLSREQICIHICPYARFQSVMYDADTLAVSYDARRGEGSAGRALPSSGLRTREERQAKGHGDCIDCGFCVQVCPTGIDIRKGLQYQCISCGLCIDACNNIMDSVGFPRGLIRYDSDHNLHSDHPTKPHLQWKRFKVIGYAAALLIMIGALAFSITTRSDTELRIQQVRQPLFVELSNERVRNRYQLHIVNKTEHDESYKVEVRGIPATALDLGAVTDVRLRPGKDLRLNVKVDLDEHLARQTQEFEFVVTAQTKPDAPLVREVHFSSGERETLGGNSNDHD